MGAGASAVEGRVFCHSCGARTACVPGEGLRCSSCGATDGVEATDQRLPTTTAGASTGGRSAPPATGASRPAAHSSAAASASASSSSSAPGRSAAQARSNTRVESVTVVAMQRPEDGGLLLRVLPNVVSRVEASQALPDPEDWEGPPEPACAAFISRLQGEPLKPEVARPGDVCVICADDFSEAGTSVVVLACGHVFHDPCIRRWFSRRHTCPTCRFELEVDDAKYLRSIGLVEEADTLERVEQEKQARELQKQAAARRRWVQSMRRGDPVHFGLVCGGCGETPLIGDCYRCTLCEGYILCDECFKVHKAQPGEKHPEDHLFVPFGFGGGPATGGVPHGPGGQLTVLLPAAQRLGHEHPGLGVGIVSTEGEPHGEAAMAAAEAAFVAVRSLAFAPLAGAPSALLLGGGIASGPAGPSARGSGAARDASIGPRERGARGTLSPR